MLGPPHDRICAYILSRRLLQPGDRVGVAVSGGADSVALLRLLFNLRDDLGLVLAVVHFNHGIRGAPAEADQEFVRDLASHLGLEVFTQFGDTPAHAQAERLSLETAARELRYGFFEQLMRSGTVRRIATGHTQDDQAETVLMRFVRGAWTKGLAGVYPELTADEHGSMRIAADQDKTIVRPLLEIRRDELREYLLSLGQDWREDASNQDLTHLRNRVRHVLLPLLEREFNPGIRHVLAGLAEIARGEEEYWREELERRLIANRTASGGLQLLEDNLLGFPLAMQRRMVRDAAAQLGLSLDFHTVEKLLGLLQAPQSTVLELSGEWIADVKLERGVNGDAPACRVIEFSRVQAQQDASPNYEYLLPVPGEVYVPETGRTITASLIAMHKSTAPQDLLKHPQIGSESLRVRNWRPGDRFWPAHSRSPKKVKELLRSRHVSGRERTLWPVIVNAQGGLIWMKDFGVAQHWLAVSEEEEAIQVVCRRQMD